MLAQNLGRVRTRQWPSQNHNRLLLLPVYSQLMSIPCATYAAKLRTQLLTHCLPPCYFNQSSARHATASNSLHSYFFSLHSLTRPNCILHTPYLAPFNSEWHPGQRSRAAYCDMPGMLPVPTAAAAGDAILTSASIKRRKGSSIMFIRGEDRCMLNALQCKQSSLQAEPTSTAFLQTKRSAAPHHRTHNSK